MAETEKPMDMWAKLANLVQLFYRTCSREELRMAVTSIDVWHKLRPLYPALKVEDVAEFLDGHMHLENTVVHGEASWLLTEVEGGY